MLTDDCVTFDLPRFPDDWSVKLIRPFGGAWARYLITNHSGICISIFLDVDRTLTIYAPCWEISPGRTSCTEQFAPEKTDEMIAAIAQIEKDWDDGDD